MDRNVVVRVVQNSVCLKKKIFRIVNLRRMGHGMILGVLIRVGRCEILWCEKVKIMKNQNARKWKVVNVNRHMLQDSDIYFWKKCQLFIDLLTLTGLKLLLVWMEIIFFQTVCWKWRCWKLLTKYQILCKLWKTSIWCRWGLIFLFIHCLFFDNLDKFIIQCENFHRLFKTHVFFSFKTKLLNIWGLTASYVNHALTRSEFWMHQRRSFCVFCLSLQILRLHQTTSKEAAFLQIISRFVFSDRLLFENVSKFLFFELFEVERVFAFFSEHA